MIQKAYLRRYSESRESIADMWSCCRRLLMLFGWREEPADWMERLGGKIEFVKKGGEWYSKVRRISAVYATATSIIELWKWKAGFSVFSALSAAWVHIDIKGATLWTQANYA